MQNKNLIAVVIVLVLVLGGAFFLNRPKQPTAALTTTTSASPVPSAIPLDTATAYSSWTLFRNGYAFPLPPDWKNTSDTGGTAVLEPGQKIGSIEKISVTRLSDEKAPQGQQFTTQPEFDQWYAVQGEVQGDIQKGENIVIDGEKAIILSDKRVDEGTWMTIIWARHENINLYITTTGTGEYTDEDKTALRYIAEHFTFTAPAYTGNSKE